MVNNTAVRVDKFLKLINIFIVDVFYVIGAKIALFVGSHIV